MEDAIVRYVREIEELEEPATCGITARDRALARRAIRCRERRIAELKKRNGDPR